MTPRQRRAEARRLFEELEAVDTEAEARAVFRRLRRFLLEEPGVRLLMTRTRRRRGKRQRLDLIAYRASDRRTYYWTVEGGDGWEYSPAASLAEARERWKAWGRVPWRPPILIAVSEEMSDEEAAQRAATRARQGA